MRVNFWFPAVSDSRFQISDSSDFMRCFALLILTSVISQAVPDTTVLDAWLRRQATITTLEATFKQARKLPSLKDPVSTVGKLMIQRPDQLRWELGNPIETLAISDGKTMTLLQSADQSARQVASDSPQAKQFSFLGGSALASPEAFREAFEITDARFTSGIYQYTLQPKERRMKLNVPWFFLDIDASSNELRALELEMKDKSRIRTVFLNTKLNGKLPAGTFQADLKGYTLK
jgi:outer membrane lipoprotein carrier protein